MVNKRSNIYLLTKGSTQEEGENAQEGAGWLELRVGLDYDGLEEGVQPRLENGHRAELAGQCHAWAIGGVASSLDCRDTDLSCTA